MNRGFVKLDNPNHQGKTNTWLTPKYIIDELGPFDLDPCAAPLPRPWDTAKTMISLPNDGLSIIWANCVWLNPPYGKEIKRWLDKLYNHGWGIALVFARTDTIWWQEHFKKSDHVFLFKGRIKFHKHDGSLSTNAGHGSCLFFYGMDRPNVSFKGVWIK